MAVEKGEMEKLLRIAFEGGSVETMLNACEDFLGLPVRLSPAGAPEESIKSRGYPQADFEELLRSIYPKDQPLGSERYLNFISAQYRKAHWSRPFLVERYTHRLMLCYVHVGQLFFGHISILELGGRLDELDEERVQTASRFVGLACMAQNMSHPMFNADELLGALLARRIRTRTRLMAESTLSEREPCEAYRLITLVMRGGTIEGVYGVLRRSFKALYPECWMNMTDETISVLIGMNGTGGRECVLKEGRLAEMIEKSQCAACVSPAFTDLLDCADEQERLLALPPLRQARKGDIVFAEDFIEYGLLFESGLSPERLRAYCCPQLKRMREDDEKNHTAHFETLRIHAACAYRASQTAEKMFVHVNTVLYRLARIRELYGLDLDAERVRFQIALSMRIWAYLE